MDHCNGGERIPLEESTAVSWCPGANGRHPPVVGTSCVNAEGHKLQ